jgi:hypothetical protein
MKNMNKTKQKNIYPKFQLKGGANGETKELQPR